MNNPKREKFWVERGLRLLEKSLNPPHELNELDWKIALSEDKKGLTKHLSAFANQAGGGFFVFGIDNKGLCKGIASRESEMIIGRLGSLSRESLEPAVQIDHHFHEKDGKSLLLIYIKESKVKPVHLRGKGIEDSYIRTGCATRKMDKVELAESIISSKNERYEEQAAYSANSPEEVLLLLDYGALFERLSVPVPTSTEKIINELEKEKLIKITGEQIVITNLGVLLLAKDIRKFSGLERKGVRTIIYKDTSRINAVRDVVEKRGYAAAFEDMLEYTMNNLPSSEVIKDAIRKEVKIYPKITVREIIANAIIHQDLHNNHLNPKVEIFTDRIEISNPGMLVPNLSIDRIIDHAEPKNELLARIMHRLGFCEDRGSGIDRALDAVEIYNLPPLKFEELSNSFKVIVYSPKKYLQMSQDERVRACYQHCVLKYLSNEKMTNKTFRERLNVAETNYSLVSKIIKQTVAEGKIKPGNPSNKSTKYVYYIPGWA